FRIGLVGSQQDAGGIQRSSQFVKATEYHHVWIEEEDLLRTVALEQGLHRQALHCRTQLDDSVGKTPALTIFNVQIVDGEQVVEGFFVQVETGGWGIRQHQMKGDLRRRALDRGSQHPRLGQIVGGDAGEYVYI